MTSTPSFSAGDLVVLVEFDEPMFGRVSVDGPSSTGEIEVEFPVRDGEPLTGIPHADWPADVSDGGFDFWPASECILASDFEKR